MKLSGAYRFDVPRERLWRTLMDTAAVGSCIPGVRAFTPLGDDRYEIELGVKVGIVSGSYKGTLAITDRVEPESYRMTFEGSGARTEIRGAGSLALAGEDGTTELSFEGDVQVTGVLARVGQRLMGSVAKSQIDRFFDCLRAKAAEA
ncbi:MAG: carbon monoxide dehydrogenase subunit G [Alphaproteobacteria bacterium]|nr:carbon monoxide dehydrogenase subunit G [Alphaproteobacteria bacterium]